MAKTVRGLLTSLKSKLDDDEGLVQRGRFVPIQGKPVVSPVPERKFHKGPGLQVRALGAADKALRPFAAAQRFVESPRSTAELFPKASTDRPTFGGKASAHGFNLASGVAGNIFGRGFLDPIIDTTQLATRTAQGRSITPYQNLKSAPSKLAYNIKGIDRNPLSVTKNTAGTIEPIFDAYLGGKVFGLGAAARQAVKPGVVRLVGQGAKTGAKGGFVGGGLYGASDRENEASSMRELFVQAAAGSAAGTALGGILGGVSAGTGAGVGKLRRYIANSAFGKTDDVALKKTDDFIRDELGRFAKKEQVKPDEPKFYGDMRESLGLPRDGDYDVPMGLQVRPKGGSKAILDAQKQRLRVRTAPGQFTNDPAIDNPLLTEARNEIGRKPTVKSVKNSISSTFDDLYTDWVNRFHPIEKLTKNIEKQEGVSILPKNNPRNTLKRFLGAGGTAELRHKKELEPIINQLDDVSLQDFDVYLKAKRDIELSGRGIAGSDADIAQQRIDSLGELHDLRKLDAIAEELYRYQRKNLDMLRDSGMLSDEAIDRITRVNQKYVPFERISDEIDDFLGVPSSKLQQSANPVSKIKGSDKAIESPLESIIANTYKTQAAIAKNNAAKSIVGLRNLGDDYASLFMPVSKAGKNTITVWERGQKRYYEAPNDIVRAVKGLNEESVGKLTEIMSAPARMFRQQTTGRNIAFMIPNALRDQLDAAVNSKYGYKPFLGYLDGLTHWVRFKTTGSDEIVEQWLNSGGGIFFESMSGRKAIKKQISDATSKKRMTKQLFDWVVGGIDVIGDISEKPTRIGLFKNALKKTGSEDLAALESREATLDFSRMGAKMKAANSIIPFLNVGVQGFDRLIRSVKDNPAGVTFALAAYGAFPQSVLSVYNNFYHAEDYAKVPDFEKHGNFILMTGGTDSEGNPTYMKFPKGHIIELSANPTDNFITWLAGNNPQSFQQLALSMLTDTLPVVGEGDNFNEIGSRTLGNVTPQAIKPTAEVLTNHDTFRNRSVVPEYLQDLPPAEQAFESTPQFYQKVGRILNVSPLKAKKWVEGTFGGGAKQISNLGHTLTSIANGEPLDPNQTFVARRFYGSYSDFDTERPERLDEPGILERIRSEFSPSVAQATDEVESESISNMSEEDLLTIYKESTKIAQNKKNAQEKIRLKINTFDSDSEREKEIKELSDERAQALLRLRNISNDHPEIVFKAGLETYTSGAGQKVPERGEWAWQQISNAKSDSERQDLINKLWEAGVLTTGKKGTAKYLEDTYNMNALVYTGDDKDISDSVNKSKKGKKTKLGKTPAIKFSNPRAASVRFDAPSLARIRFENPSTPQATTPRRVDVREMTESIRKAGRSQPQRIKLTSK